MIEDLKNITDKLQGRMKNARNAIAEAALENNWDKAQVITAAAKQLQEVSAKIDGLNKEVRKAIAEFDAATKSHTKAKHTRLSITVRWTLSGENRADEVIDDDSAADTVKRFLKSLVAVYGQGILLAVERLRVGNSGLVSRDTARDFRNPNTDEPYAFREIGDTGWSVKTHSSTAQKMEQIDQIRSLLGMPRESVEIGQVEK